MRYILRVNSPGKVAIIGQGYVGLPLSMIAVGAGYEVVGIESDLNRLDELNSRVSYIEDVSVSTLSNAFDCGRYSVSDDYNHISDADFVIFCLPTPIDTNREPDLSILLNAFIKCSKFLSDDVLLISESTSYPGTLRNLLAPLLVTEGQTRKKILLAVAPERVDPANRNYSHADVPRLLSGLTVEATARAKKFYESLGMNVVVTTTPEVAEAAKLLENTFRQVNIALVNEFSKISNSLRIDVREVIEAADSKPFGFMKFSPGPGVGGHCIPVDPHYLTWVSRKAGFTPELIEKANEINLGMPKYVVSRFISLFRDGIKNKRVLIAGLAYKSGVADFRESPALEILNLISMEGAETLWHDPLIHNFAGKESADPSLTYDGVIITLPKLELPVQNWVDTGAQVFDCTGFYQKFPGVIQL